MDSNHLKNELQREIVKTRKIMQLNGELIDHVAFTARWLLKFCEERNIEPPNLNELSNLIKKIREQAQQMDELYNPSDESKQGYKSDGEVTEPFFGFCQDNGSSVWL